MSPGVVSDQRLALLSERAKEMVTEINLVADYHENLLESTRACLDAAVDQGIFSPTNI